MPDIRRSEERERGCGFRQGGGLYLVTDCASLRGCGKMPLPLAVCPTCGQGVKPARGWTWVNALALFENANCIRDLPGIPPCVDDHSLDLGFSDECRLCYPRLTESPTMGLIWVGEKFYPTPRQFMAEALGMGISRRISRVPLGFKAGVHWVLLAHRKTIVDSGSESGYQPGVFFLFKPRAIEYVVKGGESEEELLALERRGIKLVEVVPVDSQGNLFKAKATAEGGDQGEG